MSLQDLEEGMDVQLDNADTAVAVLEEEVDVVEATDVVEDEVVAADLDKEHEALEGVFTEQAAA